MSTLAETQTSTPKKRKVAPLVALALTLALLGMIGVRYKGAVATRNDFAEKSQTQEQQPVETRRFTVTHGAAAEWEPTLAIVGTLTPIRESNLSFKVSGRLATVEVATGQLVKTGQRLASLDSAETAAQVTSASAQVHASEVELAIARDTEERSRALMAQGAASDAQHRTDAQRVQLAEARLDQAKAQLATAVTAQANNRLVAPFAGRITLGPSAPGATVSPGTTLFRIEDTSALRLIATLSAEDAPLVAVGAKVGVEGRSEQGRVTAVLPSVEAQTRRVPMLAEIDNNGSSPLLAGVLVRATITAGSGKVPVVKLPSEALRPGSQDEVVVVEDGKAKIVRVTFTRGKDGALLVRQGLSERDSVVLGAGASTKTGDALNVQVPSGT